MAVVTPADRPKSVCNRCVIEKFGGFLCCHFAFLIYLGVGSFFIGLSQISSFCLVMPLCTCSFVVLHIVHSVLWVCPTTRSVLFTSKNPIYHTTMRDFQIRTLRDSRKYYIAVIEHSLDIWHSRVTPRQRGQWHRNPHDMIYLYLLTDTISPIMM